jgi:hypothetical protein
MSVDKKILAKFFVGGELVAFQRGGGLPCVV